MNAIVIGATSGIGRALAERLAAEGHRVAVTGRREDLLTEISAGLGERCIARRMDVADTAEARTVLTEIWDEFETVDLVILSAGIGFLNPERNWEEEHATLAVNVDGFTALANAAFNRFMGQGSGHLVGISSIGAVRGGPAAAYNASKAYQHNYLEGLRVIAAKAKADVHVTDIMPGFVDTRMAQGEGLFWVAPVEKAADQILTAIRKKKRIAYVTRRWRLVASLLRVLPEWIYRRI